MITSNPKIILADNKTWITTQFALYPDTIVIITQFSDGALVFFRDEEVEKQFLNNIEDTWGIWEKQSKYLEISIHGHEAYRFTPEFEYSADALQIAFWIVTFNLR